MKSQPLNFAKIRRFAPHFWLALPLLLLYTARAAEEPSQELSLSSKSSQLSSSPESQSLINLRLQGVVSIDLHETAYFTETTTGMVISMSVGESLPEGYTLVAILNGDDCLRCRAVISDGNLQYHIGVEDFMRSTIQVTRVVDEPEEEEEDPSAQTDRVAVRPWVDPNLQS